MKYGVALMEGCPHCDDLKAKHPITNSGIKINGTTYKVYMTGRDDEFLKSNGINAFPQFLKINGNRAIKINSPMAGGRKRRTMRGGFLMTSTRRTSSKKSLRSSHKSSKKCGSCENPMKLLSVL